MGSVVIMKGVCIQSSPNVNGLMCQLAQALLEGAKGEGTKIELIYLNKLKMESCIASDKGWGHSGKKVDV